VNIRNSINYFRRSINYIDSADDLNLKVLAKLHIAEVYIIKNEFDKALDYNFKCLEIKKEKIGEKHVDKT
jgi:predicted negative regulator of RcsB-dependent stress response